MTTFCIQCAMQAMTTGKPAEMFDETPEEHMRRVHPDPVETRRERDRLEAKLMKTATQDGKDER